MTLFCCFRAAAAAILVVLAVLGTMPAASAAEIVVFAAASLKEALDEATHVYAAQSGDIPKISYAASSALAKQIESGAPAEMFMTIAAVAITPTVARARDGHSARRMAPGSVRSPPSNRMMARLMLPIR